MSDPAAFLASQLDAEEKWWATEHDRTGVKARAIREIMAKRVILIEHRQFGSGGPCSRCADWDSHPGFEMVAILVPWPCRTVLALAAVYSGQPGYDPEWNPDF